MTLAPLDFQPWRVLRFSDRSIVSQDFTFTPDRVCWVAQDHGSFLRLGRFDIEARVKEVDLHGLGHGDYLESGIAGLLVTKNHSGRFVTISPDGKTHPGVWPVHNVGRRSRWFQGECAWSGYVFRVYGCPMIASGPKYPDQTVVHPSLHIWQAGKRTTVPLTIGRDDHGHPIGGKLEVEGCAIYIGTQGNPWLVVGVVTGYHGAYEHRLYRARLTEV